MIAAAVHRARGLFLPDQVSRPAEQAGQPGYQVAFSGIRVRTGAVGQRLAPRLDDLPVGQNDFQRDHVPARGTVLRPTAAGGVDGDDAAHRRHAAVGRVGTEDPSALPEVMIEPFVDQTRLHPHPVLAGVFHPPKVLRKIDDQAPAKQCAGRARAGAAGVERNLLLGGILHAGSHVGGGAGADHAQRLDLVDARVARIHLQEQVVATDVAGNQPSQVVLNPLALLVQLAHGWS